MRWRVQSASINETVHATTAENAMCIAFSHCQAGARLGLIISANTTDDDDEAIMMLTENVARLCGDPIPANIVEACWAAWSERENQVVAGEL